MRIKKIINWEIKKRKIERGKMMLLLKNKKENIKYIVCGRLISI
jgi:hypothetical protein